MHYFVRRPFDLPLSQHTPAEVFRERKLHRRELLRRLGLAGIAAGLAGLNTGCERATDQEIFAAGAVEPLSVEHAQLYPARRNDEFEYGREETPPRAAAEFTNFYEFTGPYTKKTWQYVSEFQTTPWTLEIGGLCERPVVLDLDEIHRRFALEERAYRHRCVEAWAMCVPWTGFPLRDLLKLVEPSMSARYVEFQSFHKPEEARYVRADSTYPWPYTEGLTLPEAMNPLTFVATGVYGEPLPKQHGAPLRMVVPWKYGFKGAKSIVRITLTDRRPATFWNTISPHEYKFESNVDPDVPHPRWAQKTEWMLGSEEVFPTVRYNGYGEWVAHLYS